jgi:hypothetical protein
MLFLRRRSWHDALYALYALCGIYAHAALLGVCSRSFRVLTAKKHLMAATTLRGQRCETPCPRRAWKGVAADEGLVECGRLAAFLVLGLGLVKTSQGDVMHPERDMSRSPGRRPWLASEGDSR